MPPVAFLPRVANVPMWSRLMLGLGFLWVAVAPETVNAWEADDTIQIGTYNLELLGSPRKPYGGQDRGPRTDEQLNQIATRIATTLDLEIVVFQEINKHSEEWTSLKSKLAAHGYKFFEGSTSDRNQFVILAWDSDEVTLDGEAIELNVRDAFDFGPTCDAEGLRKPVAGRFKAKNFDFWVVGVHLKSRSGTEACTAKIRKAQCQDLVAKIDDLVTSSGERDVLIVGDCNEHFGHDSFAPLVEAGFISQMKFLKEGSAKGSYVKTASLNESDDLIDHIWLRYAQTQELVRRSAFVMSLESRPAAKKYIIEQSDHVPAWASFRIDEDLDEED